MTQADRDPPSTLTLRIGHWFEAKGTGWRVVAITVLTLVMAVIAAAQLFGR